MRIILDRTRAAALGKETIKIVAKGHFSVESKRFDIKDDVDKAVASTVTYAPEIPIPLPPPRFTEIKTSVHNETTLSVARRLVMAGLDTATLNFASASSPGGGFQYGALAQEESLCRSSALYHCIKDSPMYEFHRRNADPVHTSWVIWSPSVPVFRDDHSVLIEPWKVSFLTSPAVNIKAMGGWARKKDEGQVKAVMRERIERVLCVAASHGHNALVLGAWGCGAFGNEPRDIADLFESVLVGPLRGQFSEVTFAILDDRQGMPVISPFIEKFGK